MVANHRSLALGSLVFLLGSAYGQFAAAVAVHPSGSDLQLRAVDLDADGDLDMAGLFMGQQFRWFENSDGQGTFGSAQLIADVGQFCSLFDMADLDTDGLTDLVVVDDQDDEVLVYMNLGDGAFAAPLALDISAGEPSALRIAELNGDGVPDIVVVLHSGSTSDIGWFAGNGAGFDPMMLAGLALDGSPSSYVAVADMDLVGGNDVLVRSDMLMLALRNTNGDGTAWNVDTIISWPEYPYAQPQLIDVDNDGDLDLAEASNTTVHWAANPVGEGGAWGEFIDHTLEPFDSAGRGMFGHNGCGNRTTLIFVPANPGLPVRWSAWVNELEGFAYRADLTIPRGSATLLADLNGDGRDDLVLGYPTGTKWYASLLNEASTTLTLPSFETLCLQGAPLTLPDAEPAGGRWSGQWVDQNILYRSNLAGTGTYPLANTYYEEEGCPVAAVTSINIVNGPTVSPALPSVLCSAQAPIQMTSEPANTTWDGLAPGNILDPGTFSNGMVACIFLDSTGAECVNLLGPITVWNSVTAEINSTGPFCFTDGEQLITAQTPPVGFSWSGDIVSWNSAGATFAPSMGAGLYTVVLDVAPMGPGQCANSDTLVISVGDVVPVVTATDFGTYCTTNPSFILTGATPANGIWSGPGVSSGLVLDPSALDAGTHYLSYTYENPEGCAASAIAQIDIVDGIDLSWTVDDLIFCKTDPTATLSAAPLGGTWSAPVSIDGTITPATLPAGTYDLVYTWNGPNNCVFVNEPLQFEVWNESAVTIDPVATLCTTDLGVLISGSPAGTWSGTVSGEGATVLFDPAVIGVGTWPVTLTGAQAGECPGDATILIEVEICSGIADAQATTLSVAPNPFTDQVVVNLGGMAARSIEVLDAAGRLVLSQGPSTTDRPVLDLQNALPGAYLLRISGTDGSLRTIRLVKV